MTEADAIKVMRESIHAIEAAIAEINDLKTEVARLQNLYQITASERDHWMRVVMGA